jgi:hypothetical protein
VSKMAELPEMLTTACPAFFILRGFTDMGKILNMASTALLTAAAVILFLPPGAVYAFHEGGEGFCQGCHLMHELPQDRFQDNGQGLFVGPESYLLTAPDPSSTCLQCHAEPGKFYSVLSSDGSIFTPGGDFYWLKKTFMRIDSDGIHLSAGDKHGHNIIAAEYGLNADSMLNSAPGGFYPSTEMGCESCHDPHAITSAGAMNRRDVPVPGPFSRMAAQVTTAGNFRLLGGVGYNGGSRAAGIAFAFPAPVAVANSGRWTETDFNHTAYGSGMSEWCGNCHSGLLNNGNKHPSGGNAKLGINIISNYNSYVKTGDYMGVRGTAYLSLVPFELGTTDTAYLKPWSTSGPGSAGTANVMCLTCHRAHASAFYNKGRWDFEATFIADSIPGYGDSGVTGNDVIYSYYGRNIASGFGRYQRSFCNKCHLRD